VLACIDCLGSLHSVLHSTNNNNAPWVLGSWSLYSLRTVVILFLHIFLSYPVFVFSQIINLLGKKKKKELAVICPWTSGGPITGKSTCFDVQDNQAVAIQMHCCCFTQFMELHKIWLGSSIVDSILSYQDLLETRSGPWCRTYQRYELLTTTISRFELWSFHYVKRMNVFSK